MKKVKLKFMIVPSELRDKCYVPNRVKIKIIDPDPICVSGLLGESGKKMIRAGLLFYFVPKLANLYIKMGIGIKVKQLNK